MTYLTEEIAAAIREGVRPASGFDEVGPDVLFGRLVALVSTALPNGWGVQITLNSRGAGVDLYGPRGVVQSMVWEGKPPVIEEMIKLARSSCDPLGV